MVIDDFNIHGPRRIHWPLEVNSPLVIDADAVLTLAVALNCLETVAGQVQVDQSAVTSFQEWCHKSCLILLLSRLSLCCASEVKAPLTNAFATLN
jgi:hypothetical protein